jgi:hypothetical protein
MPKKREPSDQEIDALAEKFRTLWRPNDVLRSWLRKHRQMVLDLVHDDWSWAAMAKVLSRAGIKYRNGEAPDWHAEGLRREFVKAAATIKNGAQREPLRDPSGDPEQASRVAPKGGRAASQPPLQSNAGTADSDLNPEKSAVKAAPRFKPVSVRPLQPQLRPTPEELAEIEQNRLLTFGHS